MQRETAALCRGRLAVLFSALLLAFAGCGGPSTPNPQPGNSAPRLPSNVTATPASSGVRITWTDNSDNEAGFNIHRKVASANEEFLQVAQVGPNTTLYLDTTVTRGVSYLYAVSVTGTGGSSGMVEQIGDPVRLDGATPTLSVTKGGDGEGSITSSPGGVNCGTDCSETLESGTTVTLTASPGNGSMFVGWGGACSGASITCVLIVNADVSVTALFSKIPPDEPGKHSLAVLRSGSGSGTVTSSPSGIKCGNDCMHQFDEGTTVTLSADSSPGSRFTGWSGGDCRGTGRCSVTMNTDRQIIATFELRHTLTIRVNGAGTVTSSSGGISCDAGDSPCSREFKHGESVKLTADAASGNRFSGWSGRCAGANESCTVEMNDDREVTATFEPSVITVTSVTGGSSDNACTLADAIEASNNDEARGGCPAGSGDDTIILPERGIIGIHEPVHYRDGLTGLPSIVGRVTIEGNGAIIERASDASEEFRIFHIAGAGDVTMRNLTVRNGHGGSVGGGAIYTSGSLVLDGVTITENRATDTLEAEGAGILSTSGSLRVQDSTISNNRFFDDYMVLESRRDYRGGGITVSGGTLRVSSSIISNNWAGGGGISIVGENTSATIVGSELSGNVGGGIYNEGEMTIETTVIRGNGEGGLLGGGMVAVDNRGTAELSFVQIMSNSATGIDNAEGARMRITNSSIIKNRAPEAAIGGIENSGELELNNVAVDDNYAFIAIGGIYNGGSLTFAGGSISNNVTYDDSAAGGLYNSGTATLTDVSVKGNEGGAGGGIQNRGQLELNKVILEGNNGPYGGGLITSGTAVVSDSSIVNNAAEDGGGIYVSGGRITLRNSQVWSNQARNHGGGIYIYSAGSVVLEEGTRVGANRADSDDDAVGRGGGIYLSEGANFQLNDQRVTFNSPDDLGGPGYNAEN